MKPKVAILRTSPATVLDDYQRLDVLHWRLKERRVYERWLEESEWGKLFHDYTPAAPTPGPDPPRAPACHDPRNSR